MNKKFTFLFSVIFLSNNCFSQIGIGTTEPRTTLEIIGQANNTNAPDGVKFPNLKSSELIASKNINLYSSTKNTIGKYNPNSKGTTVYIYEIDETSTDPLFHEITTPGTYYYDGNTWQTSSSIAIADIIEYGSKDIQSLMPFTLSNGPQSLTFKNSDKILSNGDIKLSEGGDYFTILEDGMYQVYAYVGVYPNKTLTNNNQFSEASAFIEFKRGAISTKITEGSDTFIGKMTNMVNMVIVPSSLVVLKKGDQVYFKIDFENIIIGSPNQGYDNSTANITNSIDGYNLQEYTKYITIRRI